MDTRTVLSQVPPEVFCKIFALASGQQSLRTTQGLWAVSSVCSHWRSVALSDPTLWARLQIDLTVYVERETVQTAANWGNDDRFEDFLDHLQVARGERAEEIRTYYLFGGVREDNEDLQEGDGDSAPRMYRPREPTYLSQGTVAALREHLARSRSVPLCVSISVPSAASPTTPYLIPFIELLLSQSHRFHRFSTNVSVSLITPDYNNLGRVRHLKTHPSVICV
ncbi:hypothetical protein F5146DRAFT_139132 [Armillaria mellea]|nr:hypothetical protein F5146DRAFT_139132 [Armillaria mellea]